MVRKKALIFTTSAGGGHRSIAEAIAEMVGQNGFDYKIADPLVEKGRIDWHLKSYRWLSRYFPFASGILWHISKKKFSLWLIKKIICSQLFGVNTADLVKSEISAYQPSLIISAYFAYTVILDGIFKTEQNNFLNVIPDPRSINPLIISRKGLNLAYDEKAVLALRKAGIPEERITVTGWFTKKKFYRQYLKEGMREKFGLEKEVFTILIVSGGEGSSYVLKILPSLFLAKRPFQLIFICGTNERLYNFLKKFEKKNPKSLKKMKVFKFTDQVAELTAASDIVIGKAGPNTLFEAIAMKKPFFAITHINGQEDGNLDLIEEKRLGYVEENLGRATELILEIIENPKVLDQFRPYILKERKKNIKAGEKLRFLISKFEKS